MTINIKSLHNFPTIQSTINSIIADLKHSVPDGGPSRIRYPGENIVQTRINNLKNGIPVDKGLWGKILTL